MSNQTPVAVTTKPQIPMTPEQSAGAEDALLRLAQIDIPEEQRRLKQVKDPTNQQLLVEMSGTVLDLLKDLARSQVELRDWTYAYMNSLSEHVEAQEDRIDTIEQFGGETTITPEDGEILAKAVIGAKTIAIHLLQGPFPIQERDDEGKQKLAEVIAYAEQAEKILADSTLVPDEEDEGDETDAAVEDEPS